MTRQRPRLLARSYDVDDVDREQQLLLTIHS
jgi:hypothetical protein